MPDWSASMQQTYEYYVVDPGTWKDVKKLDNVKSSSVSRDVDAETLGSASINITDAVGECYIRIYLITIQNGIREKFPLGTVMVQTPSSGFDGKVRDVTMDAYTPLIELKEKQPLIGYYIAKGENIMDAAYKIVRENVRAPVVEAKCSEKLLTDFVADTSDTQLTFTTDLIANAKYVFDIDEMGRVLFSPKQDTASLQPVWTYDDSNSSILYPTLSMDHDLYGVPNVVEVIYSNGSESYYARVVNDDPNSPTSTVNRGREIIHRITDPDMVGVPSKAQIDEYAEMLLKELSTLEYTITYKHGYCPVRLGDCVRLNYERAGLTDIKAKVVSQNIECVPGCPVTEKAVFTAKLWR
ncbi:MAG: phage tail protein [Ruminococcus sp.]|nr:phage tail protein [Ruminococcus sp.]